MRTYKKHDRKVAVFPNRESESMIEKWKFLQRFAMATLLASSTTITQIFEKNN